MKPFTFPQRLQLCVYVPAVHHRRLSHRSRSHLTFKSLLNNEAFTAPWLRAAAAGAGSGERVLSGFGAF